MTQTVKIITKPIIQFFFFFFFLLFFFFFFFFLLFLGIAKLPKLMLGQTSVTVFELPSSIGLRSHWVEASIQADQQLLQSSPVCARFLLLPFTNLRTQNYKWPATTVQYKTICYCGQSTTHGWQSLQWNRVYHWTASPFTASSWTALYPVRKSASLALSRAKRSSVEPRGTWRWQSSFTTSCANTSA